MLNRWRRQTMFRRSCECEENLPSLFIPASKQRCNRQLRHWFRWVLSTGQLPRPWFLQIYCRFRRMDRLKKPAQLQTTKFIHGMWWNSFTHRRQIFHNVFPKNYLGKLYMAHPLEFDLEYSMMNFIWLKWECLVYLMLKSLVDVHSFF